jgi:hypothetical protein
MLHIHLPLLLKRRPRATGEAIAHGKCHFAATIAEEYKLFRFCRHRLVRWRADQPVSLDNPDIAEPDFPFATHPIVMHTVTKRLSKVPCTFFIFIFIFIFLARHTLLMHSAIFKGQ